MEYAETNTSIIFDKPFFNQFVNNLTETVTKIAVKETRKELMKEIELSTKEASLFLGCSVPTIIKYCNKNNLPHKKIGEKYVINKYDLEEFKKQL